MKQLQIFDPFAFLLVGVLFTTTSCSVSVRGGHIEEEKKAADQAIETFHQRLSDGEFDAIYQTSHQALRNTANREDLLKSMKSTHDRYGRIKAVTFSTFNVTPGNPIQVRAVYNVTCEKGYATEQFILVREGSQMLLAFYSVSPGTVTP